MAMKDKEKGSRHWPTSGPVAPRIRHWPTSGQWHPAGLVVALKDMAALRLTMAPGCGRSRRAGNQWHPTE